MVSLTGFFCICYLALNVVYGEPISNFTKPDPLPKYFGIDVDNTFYIQDTDTMKKNVDALKLLKSKNITPFFCTGRNFESNRKMFGQQFFDETGYSGYPGVYCNGGIVYDSQGKIIHIDKLSTEFLDKFKKFLDENNLMPNSVFYTNEGLKTLDQPSDDFKKLLDSLKLSELKQTKYEQLKSLNVMSIGMYGNKFDDSNLKKDVYSVYFKKCNYYQISPTTTNKKVGLEKLLQSFESNGNDCAYIGDGENDLECLDYCSTSFAVGNAIEKAKDKAKWVVDLDYDQGAFAKVVELMCK